MPLDLIDDKSTLVQVMAWCHQATSHYLNQCWPRSMSPNNVTRPQSPWKVGLQIHVVGLVQDCSNSIANALESLQSFTKPSMYRCASFTCILLNHIKSIAIEIALRWMPQNFTDDRVILVWVMAWSHQAPDLILIVMWCLVVPIPATELTHWGRDKMDAISMDAFSNTFSWMKIYKFRLKFHWSLFPAVKSTIFQHWFR